MAREVLAEKIPSKAYDCYIVLSKAVQMLYSRSLRNNGWSETNIVRLNQLLWSHAIKAEECYGLGICTENLEYSVHSTMDIRRHSSMDNYSCETYERAIRTHKQQKNNAKGLEKTFAARESIRDFLVSYKDKNGPFSTYNEGQPKYQFLLDVIGDGTPFYFHETSFDSAVHLLKDMQGHLSPAVQHAISCGVALGKIRRKVFPGPVLRDIERYFNDTLDLPQHAIPNVLQSLKSLAIIDEYGDIERISKDDVYKCASADGSEEWIIEMSDLFQVGPVQGAYYTFVNGKYFIPGLYNGQVVTHPWTNTTQFVPHVYNRNSVQPISCVKRKVMMYPEPSNLDTPSYFLCIDFKNTEVQKAVHVPIYPDVGDIVKLKGANNQVWFGKVNAVDLAAKKTTIQWYQETRRQGIWVLMNVEDSIYFRSIIGLANATRTFGGYTLTEL